MKSSREARAISSAARRFCIACAACGVLVSACAPRGGPPAPAPEVIELLFVRPPRPDLVLLNEDLVFYFSREIDRASATRASLQIRSGGEEARGSLLVDGEKVRFVPAPVLAADLSDGGYRPDTEYTVSIAGFPDLDGLRGIHGEPLSRSRTWKFHTVAANATRSGFVFEDRQPDKFGVLRMVPPLTVPQDEYFLGPQDAIYLACDKPIDPSTLHDDDFELRSPNKDLPPVTVRARLIENQTMSAPRPRPPEARSSSSSPAQWVRERRAGLIELTPKETPATGSWSLFILPAHREHSFCLRDFSGQPVVWQSSPRPLPVRVGAQPRRETSLSLDFLDRRMRSPVEVPGADGTAYWSENGRVEVRYPAAAGSGADDDVILGVEESRADVQATRIQLPAQRTCAWKKSSGLAVLRSQGKISIAGKLERRVESDSGSHASADHVLERWQNANDVRKKETDAAGQTLSEWLAAAASEDLEWTVLIAGGDLVIEGELDVNTPLILCAGGVVRVSGAVHGERGKVFRLGEGGGLSIDPPAAPAPSFIKLDPPIGRNPLRVPLRLAVMSQPIPETGRVSQWWQPETGGSRDSDQRKYSGSWSVRYLRESSPTSEIGSELEAFDSPLAFDRPTALQLRIDLIVQPGEAWDPPFVDFVHLKWDP
jgi:hypothetical protein